MGYNKHSNVSLEELGEDETPETPVEVSVDTPDEVPTSVTESDDKTKTE